MCSIILLASGQSACGQSGATASVAQNQSSTRSSEQVPVLTKTTTATADSEAAQPVAVVIHVDAMPQFTGPAVDCLKNYSTESAQEIGAKKVEVMQQIGRPNHFTIYEVWANQKAYDEHVSAKHTLKFRRDLAEMLGAPFDERPHHLLENPSPTN